LADPSHPAPPITRRFARLLMQPAPRSSAIPIAPKPNPS